MNTFSFYFVIGRDHILDYVNGYDHILFIVALCVIYLLHDWKKLLVLTTFFTLGHSVTLALSIFQILVADSNQIEFFIPMTILITALSNIFQKKNQHKSSFFRSNYAFAFFFGLIHGMGFSSYLYALLGNSQHILIPLLSFNLGLEFGQLIIIAIFMVASYLLVNGVGISRRTWTVVISFLIVAISLVLLKQNIFW